MSFWKTVGDLAGKAGKAVFDAAVDAKDRHDDYVIQYQSMTTGQLEEVLCFRQQKRKRL